MHDIDVSTITKRSIQGVVALTSRTLFIQVIGQVVAFVLTLYLTPEIYGVFFLVSALIVFFTYFSDIGLAAALIQKKEDITKDELKTTFTIQQALVLTIVVIGFLIGGFIQSIYKLEQSGLVLYYSLLIAFFLSSLKTIPSILLERELKFNKLVIPDFVEVLVFNITILILAIKGYGLYSFALAVVLRGLLGLIAIYIIRPCKIEFGFSKIAAKNLMSFGIPFQLNSILALLKDQLLIIYLGAVLSATYLGYIGFAQKWAYIPLRLFMDNIIRITFPSFSRLAKEPELLGRALEKSLFAVMVFIFPIISIMIFMMPSLIDLIPRYNKWEPAIVSFTFFSLNAALSAITTPLTNALNAIGRIKMTLYLMVFWTISTWILTILAIEYYSYNGVAIASFVISLSIFAVVLITKKFIKFNFFSQLYGPLISTIIMSLFIYIILPDKINIIYFISIIVFAIVIYIAVLVLLVRTKLVSDIRLIKNSLK